jgi:hypothetical protein
VPDTISNFDRRQLAIAATRREVAEHAFTPDERDWGWFDPKEWFDFVREISSWNNKCSDQSR